MESKASKTLEKIAELGPQFRTQVKRLRETYGTRHIRNLAERALQFVGNMQDPSHPSPSPADDESVKALSEAAEHLGHAVAKLKQVRETRRRKRT